MTELQEDEKRNLYGSSTGLGTATWRLGGTEGLAQEGEQPGKARRAF